MGKLALHGEWAFSWIEQDLVVPMFLINVMGLIFHLITLSIGQLGWGFPDIQPTRESCCTWRGILGKSAANWMALAHTGSTLDLSPKPLGGLFWKGHNLYPSSPICTKSGGQLEGP